MSMLNSGMTLSQITTKPSIAFINTENKLHDLVSNPAS